MWKYIFKIIFYLLLLLKGYESRHCQNDWSFVKGLGCIKSFDDLSSWKRANELCRDENAELFRFEFLSKDADWSPGYSTHVGRSSSSNHLELGLEMRYPNSVNDSQCVEWVEDLKLVRGIDCERDKNPFICVVSTMDTIDNRDIEVLDKCPEGWIELHSQCFFFPSKSVTNYDEAKEKCTKFVEDRSTLATIRSYEANELVKKNIKGPSYIGLFRHENSESFYWADGGIFDGNEFSSWAVNYPIINSTLLRVEMQQDGNWRNVDHNGVKNYVCSMHKIQCPKNFIFFHDTCYYFSKEVKNFENAQKHCEGIGFEGASLAIVPNERLNDFFLKQLNNESAFIGLYLDKKEKAVTWMDGSQVKAGDYTNWMDDLGVHSEYDNCVAYSSSNRRWDFFKCETEMRFICEIFPHKYQNPNCNDFNDKLNWLENPENGICYMIVNKRRSHSEAEQVCSDLSHTGNQVHLVSIHSPSEHHFIVNAFEHRGRRGAYWIGFLKELGFFTWTDTTAIGYSNLDQNSALNEGCGKLPFHDKNNKWKSVPCEDTKLPFMCSKKGKNYIGPNPTSDTNDCPKGWLRVGFQCLLFSTKADTYEKAKGSCGEMNATLAYIQDEKTTDVIQRQINFLKGGSYFFGLNDVEMEGVYLWPDGSRLSGYENWFDYSPTDHGHILNCMTVNKFGKWDDAHCEEKAKYICSLTYSICPSHWHPLYQRCFYTSSGKKLKFEEAQRECTKLNSNLASIHSEHENIYVASTIKDIDQRYWIGLRKDNYVDEYLKWVDGSELDYWHMNFRENLVKTDDNKQYVFFAMFMNHEGIWRTLHSSNTFDYVCSTETSHFMSCPHGWKKSSSSCYHLVKEEKIFKEASRDCISKGGYLAKIEDVREQDYIFSELFSSNEGPLFKSIWFGLKAKRSGENYFLWEDGTEVEFSHWEKGNPIAKEGHDCVWLDETQHWRNVECKLRSSYLCEAEQKITEFPPPSEGGCTHSQIPFQGSCFEIFLKKETFSEALKFCKANGGFPLKIKDLETQARLISYIHQFNEDFFLGLRFNRANSTWSWLDGTNLDRFANWADDQPNTEELGEELCAVLTSNSINLGMWKTTKCSRMSNIICQYKRHGFTDPPEPTTPMTTLDPNYKCPKEYKMINMECYYYSESRKKNFNDAEEECSFLGGHLVAFRDKEHEKQIKDELVSDYPFPDAFIGLKEFPVIGGFHWLNPSVPFGSYVNWAHNQPDSHGGSTACVYINADKWEMSNCFGKHSFICSVQPRSTSFPTLPSDSTPVVNIPCQPGEENGWFKLTGEENLYCYKIGETEESWHTSLRRCRDDSGELASIHNLRENHLLWQKLKEIAHDPWFIWIGASNLYQDDAFRWTDGSIFNYQNWKIEENVNPLVMDSCGQMLLNEEGLWSRSHCSFKRGFVCKRPQNGIFPTPPPPEIPEGHCEKGLAEYKGYCYQIFPELKMNWNNAEIHCRMQGSHLASVHSVKEMAFITGVVLPYMKTCKAWIGFYDIILGEGYGWTDENPVDYTNWADNEPMASSNNRSCVLSYTRHRYRMGKWTNGLCDSERSFFCKHPARPAISDMTFKLPYCKENEEFIDLNGNCFLYVDEPKTWSEAESYCRSKGSHLVAIQTVRENSLLTAYSQNDSWIGLSFSRDSNELVWSDTSDFVYENFDLNEQVEMGFSNYVLLDSQSGKWKILKSPDSTVKNAFWCSIKAPVEYELKGICPEVQGWLHGPLEHCYVVGEEKFISYEDAESLCINKYGGVLAGIHSKLDNDWLRKKAGYSQTGHWIGLQRVILETGKVDQDNFYWLDLEPFKGGFQNWVRGYRNKKGILGTFIPSTGKWSLEESFEAHRPYICSARKTYTTHPPIIPTPKSLEQNNGGVVGIIIGLISVASVVSIAVYLKFTNKCQQINFRNILNSYLPGNGRRVISFQNDTYGRA